MVNSAIQESKVNKLSQLSDQTQFWENITVQQLQNPDGEGHCHFQNEHTLFVSLAARPIKYLQVQDGKTHTGLYRRGDISLTPANIPLFARWEGEENCLKIRLTNEFIQKVARETLPQDCDRLKLVPEFQVRNSQIEAIGMMLLNEIQQESSYNRLYVDSLANVLAVNLLRDYTTTKPKLPIYQGGLPPRQLSKVLDYIDTYLDRKIQLVDLAGLLNMSSFHFSRLFKQSIGTSPHQYLSQQRIEKAKHLLKKTDRLIVDIALECGFNNHSHLSKQFRQFTGMTPKAYRAT